jgi:hypothetical protein
MPDRFHLLQRSRIPKSLDKSWGNCHALLEDSVGCAYSVVAALNPSRSQEEPVLETF